MTKPDQPARSPAAARAERIQELDAFLSGVLGLEPDDDTASGVYTPSRPPSNDADRAFRQFAAIVGDLFDARDADDATNVLLGDLAQIARPAAKAKRHAEDDPEYVALMAALTPEERAELEAESAAPKSTEDQVIDALGEVLDQNQDDDR